MKSKGAARAVKVKADIVNKMLIITIYVNSMNLSSFMSQANNKVN